MWQGEQTGLTSQLIFSAFTYNKYSINIQDWQHKEQLSRCDKESRQAYVPVDILRLYI